MTDLVDPLAITQSLAQMSRPAYTPQDYYRVQEQIEEYIADLADLVPAFSLAQKRRLVSMLKIPEPLKPNELDINEVTAQYQLVIKIRNKVLDEEDHFLDEATPRDATSLVNAISNLIGLFIRNEARFNQMKEIADTRAAVLHAMEDMPEEVKQRFLTRLRDLQAEE